MHPSFNNLSAYCIASRPSMATLCLIRETMIEDHDGLYSRG